MKKIIFIIILFGLLLNNNLATEIEKTNELPKEKSTKISSHSPMKAALKSIIPGAGQFYNKKYLKGCIAFITDITFLYWLYYHKNKEKKIENLELIKEQQNLSYKFTLLCLWSWEFFMIDAYIDGHFYDEEVSSTKISPGIIIKDEF